MVGFGYTACTSTLGTNDWYVVGFSPRRPATTMYVIRNGYEPDTPVLAELGPHTTGTSCLCAERLDVLERLLRDVWATSSA